MPTAGPRTKERKIEKRDRLLDLATKTGFPDSSIAKSLHVTEATVAAWRMYRGTEEDRFPMVSERRMDELLFDLSQRTPSKPKKDEEKPNGGTVSVKVDFSDVLKATTDSDLMRLSAAIQAEIMRRVG